jgi:hypothetical protein
VGLFVRADFGIDPLELTDLLLLLRGEFRRSTRQLGSAHSITPLGRLRTKTGKILETETLADRAVPCTLDHEKRLSNHLVTPSA